MAVILSTTRQRLKINISQLCRLFLYAISFVGLPALCLDVSAQMVDPSLDSKDQPFSYFSKPTDVIGWMDAPAATEITPEGYLYTGYGELIFFVGDEYAPVDARVKELENGYLPIVHYSHRHNGITYNFTVFEASLDGTPEGCLVNFIKVVMRNTSTQTTRAVLSVGSRYNGPMNTGTGISDHRFRRPATATRLGDYRQLGEPFDSNWIYGFAENQFTRNGRAVYLYSSSPQARSLTLAESYNESPNLAPRRLDIEPSTAVGIVKYSKLLKPGEEESLTFKMPVIPIAQGEDLARIQQADFDRYRILTINFWDKILNHGMILSLPETKVTDTFNASLVYDLIARDKIRGHYIQTVNKFQYHQFFIRDSADIAHMYDLTGYPEFARQILEFFPEWQQPDGNFLSQPQEYDAWGEVLWAYGQHFRMTQDRPFAERALPQIMRALEWLKAARATDSLHLIPASHVADNENVPGHITGYNFLALAGLKVAIEMADGLGREQEAYELQTEYNGYDAQFLKVLADATRMTGGYIPPTLDGNVGGQDWGNLLGTYPEHVLAPDDPQITATLKAVHAKYQEGIMTYGNGQYLHHYLTIKNTETELIRGEQEQAIRELYALLLHTSSTHAGFEFAIRPWGDRDFQDNLAPHGWFAAEYRTLIRNMLVREDGRTLHLLSALSPAWIGAGKKIAVENVPTAFGTMALSMEQPDDLTAIIHLDAKWRSIPEQMDVHLPWFMKVSTVEVDGTTVDAQSDHVTVPSSAQRIVIHWQRDVAYPQLSYDHTVDGYKDQYRQRYDLYMHGVGN